MISVSSMAGSIAEAGGGGENSRVIPGVFWGLVFEIVREVFCRGDLDSAGFERFPNV
jgi:hypothetical protein